MALILLACSVAVFAAHQYGSSQVWWSNDGITNNLAVTLNVEKNSADASFGYFTFTRANGNATAKIVDSYSFTDGVTSETQVISTDLDIGVWVTIGNKTSYSVAVSGSGYGSGNGVVYSAIGENTIGENKTYGFGFWTSTVLDSTVSFAVIPPAIVVTDPSATPVGQPLPGVLATMLIGGGLAGLRKLRRRK